MKLNNTVVACCLLVLAMEATANEKTFEVGRSGFLVNSNRIAFASFSKFKLTVNESDGQFELPCLFAYEPGIGGDKCTKIEFSSVMTERNLKTEMQSMPESAKATSDGSSAMPRLLRIGPLSIEADGPEDDPLDAVFTITDAKSEDIYRRQDVCLYRRVPETYFRYLSSDELDAEYWWVRFLGKRVEYRIRPVRYSGNDYIVEDSDLKSRHFSKMVLTYAKCGDDFRLKKIVLTGDHTYQGGPLKLDPASLEVRGCFEKSKSTIVESQADGIVETGYGILKSQQKVKYTMHDQKSNERFKVVIEICETT